MRENGEKLAEIMERLKKEIKPGKPAVELNELAYELILNYGAKPSFKGYDGFPASLCVSINEEVVHGLPADKRIKKEDIVSLDLGLYKNGFHSDMAFTVFLGKDKKIKRLIKTTEKVLHLAVKKCRPGNTFGDIGHLIHTFSVNHGFGVVRELCGHGIGKKLHEPPQILNFGEEGSGEEIKPGMVFCLEPMLTMGGWQVEKAENGSAYKTKDNSLSAHFEHMVAVTERGPKLLTKK